MAQLETRREIELPQLAGHGLLDRLPVVPRPAGPEPGERIEELTLLVIDVIAPLGAGGDPWVRAKITVAAVGHLVVVVELGGWALSGRAERRSAGRKILYES